MTWLNRTSDLKTDTTVDTLPGSWHYWVSVRTSWRSVSIWWLGEIASLICSFYFNVERVKLSKRIHPWDALSDFTHCFEVEQPRNNSNPKLFPCFCPSRKLRGGKTKREPKVRFFFFFFFFFLRSPAISLGFTTFGWDFCVCDRFF